MAPSFSASADFALDKRAGQPCPNLLMDFRCGIHDRLRERGFAGCTVYDCFGAGQRVVQDTFGGRDWRGEPALAGAMFTAFMVMRQLHELLWYLGEALTLEPARALWGDLQRAFEETEQLTHLRAGPLAGLDVAPRRRAINVLLMRASELVRSGGPGLGPHLRRADLTGKDLRGAELAHANLRGATVLGADLRRADLRQADFIGADLRAADLRGADLTGAFFLIQSQLDSARGDRTTVLPASMAYPAHWPDPGNSRPGRGRRTDPRRG